MRVVLVDDEPLALDRLAFAFRDIADTQVVGTAADGEAAAALIESAAPDLVVLDIQMPGRTGLAVASGLVGANRPEIVFVTAYEQFAPDAFDVEAVDYLIKPVRFDRLRQAVERARRRRRERDAAAVLDAGGRGPQRASAGGDMIVVPDPRGDRHVALAAIQWVEAAKDYVLLHTATHSLMLRATMARLEEQLRPPDFLRIHRSAIVNVGSIQRHRRTERGSLVVVLADGFELNVGPSYVRDIAQRLMPLRV